ncbi:MAG: radical SAM protein [Candidatus Methanomethylicia archaeon]|nr:radical SAM protein [Candidatus Methanomethylicia archaeon]
MPAKHCTYSCVYCQAGRTPNPEIERRRFFDPKTVFSEVQEKHGQLISSGGKVDYITFVPDGEPTLDNQIGSSIRLLKEIGIPVAVITNASLLWRGDVVGDLAEADLVSIKVDATDVGAWRRVNRPHGGLILERVLRGISEFASSYKGDLISETMLVGGHGQDVQGIAYFLSGLGPLKKAYISTVTRPPAEASAGIPSDAELRSALRIFEENLGRGRAAVIAEHEGDLPYVGSGDLEGEILGIAAVHPLREEALAIFVSSAGGEWGLVERLVSEGKLEVMLHGGIRYYLARGK